MSPNHSLNDVSCQVMVMDGPLDLASWEVEI